MPDPEHPPASAAPASSRETILLVDDDALVRRQTRRTLESAGYAVIEAGDAEDAITSAGGAETGIALLVSDVRMPGVSGPSLAIRLRADRPALRVLFTSGAEDDTIRQAVALERGVAFLGKPYSPATLIATVREILATDA